MDNLVFRGVTMLSTSQNLMCVSVCAVRNHQKSPFNNVTTQTYIIPHLCRLLFLNILCVITNRTEKEQEAKRTPESVCVAVANFRIRSMLFLRTVDAVGKAVVCSATFRVAIDRFK